MLGVLEMDIDACINTYTKLAKEVFPKPKIYDPSRVVKAVGTAFGGSRYDYKKLETVVKEIVKVHAKLLIEKDASDDRARNHASNGQANDQVQSVTPNDQIRNIVPHDQAQNNVSNNSGQNDVSNDGPSDDELRILPMTFRTSQDGSRPKSKV